MKFDLGTRRTGWLREILRDILHPGRDAAAKGQSIGQLTRQGLAVVLSALMIMIPMTQGEAFAQSPPVPMPPASAPPSPPVPDNSQPVPQGQPLSVEQLDQLVATRGPEETSDGAPGVAQTGVEDQQRTRRAGVDAPARR